MIWSDPEATGLSMLDRAVIDGLFPADLPEPEHWEQHYPPRQLPEGAQVTRFCPSPTGFMHIGGVYVATIDRDIAAHSGGVYLVRVEDTDQSREVEGALVQFARAIDYFGIPSDENDQQGS
jgi:glutamyl-tRNA synthetase